MKKSILLFSVFALMAFKADVITDYRDAYVGNYHCRRTFTIATNRTANIHSDTLTINISKDVLDSVMDITIEGRITMFKLNGGSLYSYSNLPQGGKFFASDSISLILTMGRAASACYYGKKK